MPSEHWGYNASARSDLPLKFPIIKPVYFLVCLSWFELGFCHFQPDELTNTHTDEVEYAQRAIKDSRLVKISVVR